MPGGEIDLIEAVQHPVRVAQTALGNGGHAHDAVHRRTHVMGHAREKAALRRVGLLRRHNRGRDLLPVVVLLGHIRDRVDAFLLISQNEGTDQYFQPHIAVKAFVVGMYLPRAALRRPGLLQDRLESAPKGAVLRLLRFLF